MKLINRVQNDLKSAVKEQDKNKSSVLRLLLSECSYAHEEDLEDIQNDEIIDIIRKYLDNLKSSVGDYSDKTASRTFMRR